MRTYPLAIAFSLAIVLASPAAGNPITIEDYNQIFRESKDGNTYKFFQAGFDGAFVTGFFNGTDINGDGAITSLRQCWTPNCDVPEEAVLINPDTRLFELTTNVPDSVLDRALSEPQRTETEVTDFALFFSGNSSLGAFLIHGVDALTSRKFDDGDDASGLIYPVGSSTIPAPGAVDLELCSPPEMCSGLIVAQEWLLLIEDAGGPVDWVPNGGLYRAGPGAAFSLFDPNSSTVPGGSVSLGSWEDFNESPRPVILGSSSDRFLRIVRVPEPGILSLFAIGLFVMALSRRGTRANPK